MSVPDPPWKKRVRPCPFYSAGRCLFSDSCNFLHEVKIKRPQEALQTHSINDAYDDENDAVPILDHAVESRRYGSTFLPPTVTVHSPQSVHSSPRSPRTASLLMALEEVIGPDDTEVVPESITLVDESGTVRSKHELQELDTSPDSSGDSASGSDEGISAESFTSTSQNGHVAAEEDEDITERLARTASHDEVPRQLPAVETSNLPDEGEDSGNNSFDLLSPVELSHGPPVPFPARKRDDSIHREDSIDSGYADDWVGPTPFALSPPRQYRPRSTLDLLSSPFGSPYRVLSPKLPPSPQFLPPSPVQPNFSHSDNTADDDIDDDVPTDFNLNPDEDDTIHPSSATTVKHSTPTLSQPIESRSQDDTDVPKPANPPMNNPSPNLGNSFSDNSQHSDVAEERLASIDLSTITEEGSSWEESFTGSFFSSEEDVTRERLAFPLPPPINGPRLSGPNRMSVAEAIADVLEESLEPVPQLSPRSMLANTFRLSKPPARVHAHGRDRTPPPEVPALVSPTPTVATVRPRAVSDLTIKAEANSVSPQSPAPSLHSEREEGSPFVPQAESSVRSIDAMDVESMGLESIGLAMANDVSSPISTQTSEQVFVAANKDLEPTDLPDSGEDSGSFIVRTLKRISLDIEALDQEQTGLESADTDFSSYIQAETDLLLAPGGPENRSKEDLRRVSNVSIFEVSMGSPRENSSPFASQASRLSLTRSLESTDFADTSDLVSPVMPQAPKRMSLNIEDIDLDENEVDFLGDMYQSYMSTPGSRRASLSSGRPDSASPYRRAAEFPAPTPSPISSGGRRFSSRSPSRYPSRAFAPSPALSEPAHPRVSSPLRDPPLSAASSSRISLARSEQRVFIPPLSSVPSTRSSSPVLDLIASFQGQTSRPSSSSSKAKGKAKAVNDEVQPVDTPWKQASAASSSKVPLGWRESVGKTSRSSTQSKRRPTILTNLPSASERITPPVSGQSTPASNLSTPIWLKPLRLSSALEPASAPLPSKRSSELISSSHHSAASISSSSTVSSRQSLSQHPLLSSVPSSAIPDHVRYTLVDSHDNNSPALSLVHSSSRASHQALPQSAPVSHSQSWRNSQLSTASSRNSLIESRYSRTSSRLSEPIHGIAEEEESFHDEEDDTVRNPIPHTAPPTRPPSVLRSPVHAIATPKPDLIFAIASDDVEEVRRVLESGEAGPNDMVGPQAPLAFALNNDQLKHKVDIVKALLAYGAEPTALNNPNFNPPKQGTASNRNSIAGTPPPSTDLEVMDPAMRYYIERANASHTRKTSALIHRSFFRPLTRVRYDIIGQDHVFEQLFKVLSAHSRQRTVTPIVVVLCGPSGHGKSLLARKFGALLEVPTHTVNMTTLRSAHDLWDSYSMSPYEEATTCTLAEFLLENEGKRCVVVLDEIEKTEDPKALYPLLMPWEIGRCSPHAGDRHIDVRNVVWLGTSNIGHDVVFEYQDGLSDPTPPMSQAEYLKLVALIRPTVSERLGASLLSRVTAVLPFVPFTENEKMALATEALHSLGGDGISSLQSEVVESTAREALAGYQPAEGARSLYRAVSSLLLELVIPNDE